MLDRKQELIDLVNSDHVYVIRINAALELAKLGYLEYIQIAQHLLENMPHE